MAINLRPTICRPRRSKRPMISPTSPRCTASGLARSRVRSTSDSFHERAAGTLSRQPHVLDLSFEDVDGVVPSETRGRLDASCPYLFPDRWHVLEPHEVCCEFRTIVG